MDITLGVNGICTLCLWGDGAWPFGRGNGPILLIFSTNLLKTPKNTWTHLMVCADRVGIDGQIDIRKSKITTNSFRCYKVLLSEQTYYSPSNVLLNYKNISSNVRHAKILYIKSCIMFPVIELSKIWTGIWHFSHSRKILI